MPKAPARRPASLYILVSSLNRLLFMLASDESGTCLGLRGSRRRRQASQRSRTDGVTDDTDGVKDGTDGVTDGVMAPGYGRREAPSPLPRLRRPCARSPGDPVAPSLPGTPSSPCPDIQLSRASDAYTALNRRVAPSSLCRRGIPATGDCTPPDTHTDDAISPPQSPLSPPSNARPTYRASTGP